MTKKIAVLILISSLIVVILPQSVKAESISFADNNYNAVQGERFNVPINLGGAVDVTTVTFRFTYDASLMSYVSLAPSPFYSSGDFGCFVMPMITENPVGTVEATLSRFGCGPGVSGSGELAVISFEAGADNGLADIDFSMFNVCYSDFSCADYPLGNSAVVSVGNIAPAINFSSNSYNADVESSLGVPVLASDLRDAATVQFNFSYDPAYLSYQSVTPGPLLSMNCPFIMPMVVENPAGTVDVTLSGFGCSGANGSGEIAQLMFNSNSQSGASNIAFNNFNVSHSDFTMDIGVLGSVAAVTVNAAADITAPVVTLNGDTVMNLNIGDAYNEPGASAWDDIDGDISSSIVISGYVDSFLAGTYSLAYNVSDAAGNSAATQYRLVNVTAVPDAEAPGITIFGDNPFALEIGDTYIDPGASAWDDVDGDLSYKIITQNSVDTASVGSYQVIYRVSDAAGNEGRAERTVNVSDSNIQEADLSLRTKEIGGYIGTKKNIRIKSVNKDNLNEIEIELPYNDNGSARVRRFSPEGAKRGSVSLVLPENTFSGQARVYYRGEDLGVFNYSVKPRLLSYSPEKLIVGGDMTVEIDSYIPKEGNTFIVMSRRGSKGKVYQEWLKPEFAGANKLKLKIPTGAVPGKMYIHTSYLKTEGTEKVIKSNSKGYKIKPIIDSVEWSGRGYEQVGDKILIKGRGISTGPVVYFYSLEGFKIDSRRAKVIEIGDIEIIEVKSTVKENKYSLRVKSGGEESAIEDSIAHNAKPRLKKLKTKYNRRMIHNKENMPGAKIGDEITVGGQGLLSLSGETMIEFEGRGQRIIAAAVKINKNGSSLKVVVPAGAQSGYLKVILNGQSSNYAPLEIIPSIVKVMPESVLAGEDMTIIAQGVGLNKELVKIHFNNGFKKDEIIRPKELYFKNNQAYIILSAPETLPYNRSKIKLQYDKWLDRGVAVLNVRPVIKSASINMDTRVLSIKGYGFSIRGKENKITYRYADENKTVISPKVKMLGVYPTDEGQEIRVKINDNYHYGDVAVAVGEQVSNTAEFGPVYINKISRQVGYVKSADAVKGVLYIMGYNFGSEGGVKVGDQWADVHYRSNFLIIAVVEKARVNDNPIIVAKQ